MPPAMQNILAATLPLPVAAIMLLQAVGITWWVSGQFQNIEDRVGALERADLSVVNHEARIIILEQRALRVSEDLAEIKLMLRERKASNGNPIKP